ncbi:MAG: hypothetical protein H0T65_21630 [Deltaproteobacteria bacterium]|nr:hypothetical protein [Deltaproteobacteria bacterium]
MSKLGELLQGGDWAVAHGDAGGLAHVARTLVSETKGKVARDLRELCELCADSYPDAAARWAAFRSGGASIS